MAKLEPFLVLASAVAEGRLSAVDFSTVCLPLYKHYSGSYPSPDHYQLATDLFYLAHDHYAGEGDPIPGTLSDAQVQAGAAEIVQRMRALLR
ncbi:hypothetical protein [Streptomyces sp. NPDC006267]|uniref:hypothetical protein n=1 Tax=Streptomyces sp. NPDC006267 TaxID=3157173 RepID=UPI0033A4320D